MKRKIIQITAIPATQFNDLGWLALCDDGTLWIRGIIETNKPEWKQLENVPQPAALEERS